MPRAQFGRDNHKAKLTDDLVREIRESDESGVALAKRFGVSTSVVSRVRSGKAWATAEGPTCPARAHSQELTWEESETGCWLVTSHKPNSDGYPVITVDGRRWYAHRWAYASRVGPIPKGQIVRHKCNTPACCRPDHLVLGTDADNVADRVAADRSARGERNGRAKLTWDDARAIRASAEGNWVTAKKYGVDAKVVRNIRAGVTWRESDGSGNELREGPRDVKTADDRSPGRTGAAPQKP